MKKTVTVRSFITSYIRKNLQGWVYCHR